MSHDYIKDLTVGVWTKHWVSNRFTNGLEPKNQGQWAPSAMGEQSRGRPPGQNCGNGSRQVGGMLEGRENPHQVTKFCKNAPQKGLFWDSLGLNKGDLSYFDSKTTP